MRSVGRAGARPVALHSPTRAFLSEPASHSRSLPPARARPTPRPTVTHGRPRRTRPPQRPEGQRQLEQRLRHTPIVENAVQCHNLLLFRLQAVGFSLIYLI